MQRNLPDLSDHEPLMSEINMTPLVDVMLVLLIIFIITMPVITHSIKVNLPQASTQVQEQRPNQIRISLDAQGQLYWNDQPTPINQLTALAQAANQKPNTQILLRAEHTTQYQTITRVMSQLNNAGVHKIALVTTPE